MQKYYDVVLGQGSNALMPVANASVTVLTSPGGVPATIYSDNGVTVTANPLTTGADGSFSFYAANGRYTLAISYLGVSKTLLDIVLEDDPTNGQPMVITGGSIDNTPIGATTPSTGAFTTLTATSLSVTAINSTPIGNVTPSTGSFTVATLVPSATSPSVNGQVDSVSTVNALETFQGGLLSIVPGVCYVGTSVATTSGTGASSWVPASAIGSLTFPAGYFTVGKTLRIKIGGRYTTAVTQGTVTLALNIGGIAVTTGAGSLTASITNATFATEIIITVFSTGATGTFGASGQLLAYNTGTNTSLVYFSSGIGTAGSLNTTISNALTMTSTNSVSGGTVFTINNFSVEVLA